MSMTAFEVLLFHINESCMCVQVCELREARLDEEDAAMEVGRAMDALKKDRESLAKKERLMDQSLKAKSPAIASNRLMHEQT